MIVKVIERTLEAAQGQTNDFVLGLEVGIAAVGNIIPKPGLGLSDFEQYTIAALGSEAVQPRLEQLRQQSTLEENIPTVDDASWALYEGINHGVDDAMSEKDSGVAA